MHTYVQKYMTTFRTVNFSKRQPTHKTLAQYRIVKHWYGGKVDVVQGNKGVVSSSEYNNYANC